MLRLEKSHWDLLVVSNGAFDEDRRENDTRLGLSRDLQRAGLWRTSPLTDDPDGRTRLFRFAGDRALIVDVFFTSGVYLAMTNIGDVDGQDMPTTTVSGSGFSVETAVLGCLGEAVEHCSWIFRQSDDNHSLREFALSGTSRLSATQVLGFSAAQLSSRERLNRAWDSWDRIPPLAELAHPRSWTRVSSFDEKRSAACPSFLCYGRYGDLAIGDPTLNVDSNGCAAGQTREAAKTRAVLELIERDATGIWWDRGCVRPRLDIAGFEPMLRQALVQHREETGRDVWFLDISSFAQAAVVAAVSCEASGGGLALGFGAAFVRRDAARSAFLELVQSEIAIEAHMVRSQQDAQERAPADRWTARWLRIADMRNFPFAAGRNGDHMADTETSVEGLLDEIRHSCGKEVWFAELTRLEFATPVVKAVCEGLAHYKLRRGSPRYADIPRNHGWRTTRQNSGHRSGPLKLLI